MQAKDLLEDIRYSLSDTGSNKRWSDKRLLSLLSAGIQDIAKTTILFVESVIVTVQDDVVDIDLSDRATKITRVEYLDEPVALKSFEEMDAINRRWQLEKGDKLRAVVYNEQKRGMVKLYPIIVNAMNENITYSSPYGVITEISYSDIQPIMNDHYGDIAGIPDEALIKFYYIRKHDKVVDVNQEIYIDELVEKPLKHYVVGFALRDNADTHNRTVGNEEINLYKSFVEEFNIEKAENYARPMRVTQYSPLG